MKREYNANQPGAVKYTLRLGDKFHNSMFLMAALQTSRYCCHAAMQLLSVYLPYELEAVRRLCVCVIVSAVDNTVLVHLTKFCSLHAGICNFGRVLLWAMMPLCDVDSIHTAHGIS